MSFFSRPTFVPAVLFVLLLKPFIAPSAPQEDSLSGSVSHPAPAAFRAPKSQAPSIHTYSRSNPSLLTVSAPCTPRSAFFTPRAPPAAALAQLPQTPCQHHLPPHPLPPRGLQPPAQPARSTGNFSAQHAPHAAFSPAAALHARKHCAPAIYHCNRFTSPLPSCPRPPYTAIRLFYPPTISHLTHSLPAVCSRLHSLHAPPAIFRPSAPRAPHFCPPPRCTPENTASPPSTTATASPPHFLAAPTPRTPRSTFFTPRALPAAALAQLPQTPCQHHLPPHPLPPRGLQPPAQPARSAGNFSAQHAPHAAFLPAAALHTRAHYAPAIYHHNRVTSPFPSCPRCLYAAIRLFYSPRAAGHRACAAAPNTLPAPSPTSPTAPLPPPSTCATCTLCCFFFYPSALLFEPHVPLLALLMDLHIH
ncbi:hypothetical protein C8J57DRAFT_1528249 [Mycena rebaudengoi]|nr:hypothetical protein C8J57DRAFT_1528249 [Mycena rebaudengoi]